MCPTQHHLQISHCRSQRSNLCLEIAHIRHSKPADPSRVHNNCFIGTSCRIKLSKGACSNAFINTGLFPAALGLGAVHCINAESQRYRARKQRNSAGAEKWMDIRMWDSPSACIDNAKAAGYHVLATHFDPEAVTIHEVDWTRPTAVLLGNEREGKS